MSRYQPPVLLAARHQLAGFRCRSEEQSARLGVDEGHEKNGLGEAIGCRGLLVHAESEQARSFYEHLIPEFGRSPTDPLHPVLLLKDIRRTLGSRQG